MPDHDTPAIKALKFLAGKYSPAGADDADTFLSTSQITQAITQHTGATLSPGKIYQILIELNFSYEVYNETEFTWLMKKK